MVGLDLGGGRAWSAAVGAVAVRAPGGAGRGPWAFRAWRPRSGAIACRKGTYTRLVDQGLVITDGDRRVPRVSYVLEQVKRWHPDVLVCDRFRYPELLDCRASRVPSWRGGSCLRSGRKISGRCGATRRMARCPAPRAHGR